MNINELMIGNWVAYKGKPYRVTGINKDGAFGETVRIQMGKDEMDISAQKVNGVEITKDNMEFNGIDSAGLVVDDHIIFCNYNALTIYSNYHTEQKPYTAINIPICYIHELQNAFRLCGIEKEIELWRV